MTFEVFKPSHRRRGTGVPPGRHAARDREIRTAYAQGESRTDLAARYELSHARICQIIAEDQESSTR